MAAKRKIKILVIDDDLIFRESICAFLQDYNFDVVEAAGGREGIKLFHEHNPDIVLLDLMMPTVSGLDVLNQLAEHTNETPFIMISGTGNMQDALSTLRQGAWDFITKPIYDFGILEHTIIRSWERAELLRKNKEYQKNLEAQADKLKLINESLKNEITERKEIEKKIRQSEQNYRLLLENSGSAIFFLDQKGNLAMLNETTAYYLGQKSEDLIGKNIDNLISMVASSNKSGVFCEKLKDATTAGKSGEYEILFDTTQGELWFSANIQPVRDTDTNIIGVQCILKDISPKRQLEEQLKQYYDQLEEKVQERTIEIERAKQVAENANRAKTEFLANMTHELRTPLHGVISFAHLGIDRFKTAPREKLLDFFKDIHSSGERLLSLLNNLLDLAKLETGKMEYCFTQTKLSSIIKKATDHLSKKIKEKNLTIRFNRPEFSDRVEADEIRILQVIQNFLSNAIKFTPPKGSIEFEIKKDDKMMTMAVIDTGVGVPNDELDKIFDKFVQSSKTDTGSGGTGLGLPICQQIIHDHNGKIWAENNPVKGSKFCFSIPISREKDIEQILAEERVISKDMFKELLNQS